MMYNGREMGGQPGNQSLMAQIQALRNRRMGINSGADPNSPGRGIPPGLPVGAGPDQPPGRGMMPENPGMPPMGGPGRPMPGLPNPGGPIQETAPNMGPGMPAPGGPMPTGPMPTGPMPPDIGRGMPPTGPQPMPTGAPMPLPPPGGPMPPTATGRINPLAAANALRARPRY